MLKRRLVAALVAVLLAGVGAMLLLGYVSAADQRAMAGMRLVNVLVVTAPVAMGATAESVAAKVATKKLPAQAAVPGRVTDLKQLTGKVTTADLMPGEQLLASRFVDPATLEKPGTVKIPPGMQQVSIALSGEKVLGGNIAAGAHVGVLFVKGAQTKLALRDVLISKVQGALAPSAPPAGASAAPEAAPPASVMVTFAVSTGDAQKLVAQSANIWLSLEPAGRGSGTSAPGGRS